MTEGAFVASTKSGWLSVSTPPSSPRTAPRAASGEGSDEGGESELPPSGSFFNAVPPPKEEPSGDGDGATENSASGSAAAAFGDDDAEMFEQILRTTKVSRDGGGQGFARAAPVADPAAPAVIKTNTGDKQSFVGIGGPLNDVQNPEYDEDGYTLYADEVTGEKSRVFEALVEYPSVFKMKIVGQDDEQESFAPEMVDLIARSCGVERSMVKHTSRRNGKWTSVTVHAPVRSADMLYALYENVDKDPRVKFKF